MKAHEILNSPETWCRESPAEDSHGNKLHAFDPRAVKWCALGAIQKVYPSSQWGEAMDCLLRTLRACLESGRGVMHFASWGIIAGYDIGTLSD